MGEGRFDFFYERFILCFAFNVNQLFFGIEGRLLKSVEGRNGFSLLIGSRQVGFEPGIFGQFLIAFPMARPLAGNAPDGADEALRETDPVLIPVTCAVENSGESFLYQEIGRASCRERV